MIRKVIHIGDIQINCDANHAERAFEYRSVLARCSDSIRSYKPDFVVIAGDIFERHHTTDDERKIYVDFIHSILDNLPDCNIIVIDGNHDIRKRNLKYFDGVDTSMYSNVLESLQHAINSKRYKYSKDAAIYDFNDIIFACWSECAKYDPSLRHNPYDGHRLNILDGSAFVVDVYHGNIAGATDLGTNFVAETSDDVLPGHIAMLGHIHKYQVLKNAVYSSSLVPRQFNEGVRYGSNKCIYDYRNSHGYVAWEIDTTDKTVKHQFVPIQSPVQYLTFVIDSDTTKDDLLALFKLHAYDNARIKFVLNKANPETLAFAYSYCKRQASWRIKAVETAHAYNMPEDIAEPELSADSIELTPDSICELANGLLRPRVDRAHADDHDYAKAVHDKTLQLLRQEAGYHLLPENRNKIKLHSVTIDNFKSIGHAELRLLKHGLQALRGQNGQGKTTCFEAIAFALTGQHNATFKRNAKNKQLLRLFNDKQPAENTVRVAVDVSIDDTVYQVLVVLTKHMQDGWTSTDWKRFVTKVDKQLQIICDNKIIATDADADNWLLQRFGTYEEFAILHMIDQQTLESLKYMSTDQFAGFILQRLGYSVLSKLQYFYNGCKNVELEKCPKPTNLSYVQVCQQIDDLSVERTRLTEELKYIEDDILTISGEISGLQIVVEQLQSQKQSVPIELVDGWRTSILPYVDKDIDAAANECYANIADLQSKVKNLQELSDKLEQAKLAYDEHMTKYVQLAKQQLDTAIATEQAKRNGFNEQLQLALTINAQRQGERSKLSMDISSYESAISSVVSDMATVSRQIDAHNSKIADLRNKIAEAKQGVCPLCGHTIDDDKFNAYIDGIKRQIQSEQSAIDEQSKVLVDRRAYLLTLQNNADYAKAELAKVEPDVDVKDVLANIQACDNNIAGYSATMSKLIDDNYKRSILTANAPEIVNAYDTAYANFNAVKQCNYAEALSEQLQEQQRLIQAKQAKEMLAKYDAIIISNAAIDMQIANASKDIDTANTKLSAKNVAKFNCNFSISKIDESIRQNEELKLAIVQYNIVTEALQHYKWLIDDALPQYLYKSTCTIVNKFIDAQNLPPTIRPWLSETDYGQLVLRDRNEAGDDITRTILEASGMEITIVGLVVCLALHAANLTVNFPMVMLDELTGKLSTGNANDDTDYLDLFLQVLKSAAEHCQIIAIDHRLKDEDFDKVNVCIKDKVTNISYIE